MSAIILSTAPAETIGYLSETIRQHGYVVRLIITAPGPNALLHQKHFDGLGERIGAYLKQGELIAERSTATPAVLALSRASQMEPLFAAYDPDIAVSFGFPYLLGKKLLSSRCKFVNLHTAPIPSLRGPNPHIWPILRPDRYPLQDFTVCAHYMVPEADRGPIILETLVDTAHFPQDTFTANDLEQAAAMTLLGVLEEILDLVKAGFKGKMQAPDVPRQGLSDQTVHDQARMLTDDERMITPDMTSKEVSRLVRAIGTSTWPPLVSLPNGIHSVNQIHAVKEDGSIIVQEHAGHSKRIGFFTRYECLDGPIMFASQKI
ncbi:hypothetical protein MBLNU13_g11266t1 [Cladosporium sp. NU13]